MKCRRALKHFTVTYNLDIYYALLTITCAINFKTNVGSLLFLDYIIQSLTLLNEYNKIGKREIKEIIIAIRDNKTLNISETQKFSKTSILKNFNYHSAHCM